MYNFIISAVRSYRIYDSSGIRDPIVVRSYRYNNTIFSSRYCWYFMYYDVLLKVCNRLLPAVRSYICMQQVFYSHCTSYYGWPWAKGGSNSIVLIIHLLGHGCIKYDLRQGYIITPRDPTSNSCWYLLVIKIIINKYDAYFPAAVGSGQWYECVNFRIKDTFQLFHLKNQHARQMYYW